MIDDRQSGASGPSLGARLSAAGPRLLARTLGPLLRRRGSGDPEFLDRLRRTHTESILAFPDEYWERLIRALGLTDGGVVLDVGCGPGGWLPSLASVNERVVGVDMDEDVLDIARERASEADNVELRRMSAEALEFAAGSFDLVACFSTLPYVDQPVAIGEMARVLRTGGRMVVGTVGSGYYAKHVAEGIRQDDLDAIRYGLDPILVAGGRAVAGNRVARSSLQSWSPRAVRRLLERQGLAVDRIIRDVDAADPSWPKTCLGRPVYFVALATKRPV